MKPKIFIGSSVEGLNVAYAVQQNLAHDAESTVWDQGVFKLSKTTIESLVEAMSSVDFGVFVFSPDDVTIMRGNKSTAIRDNVLFELGLFIGKLGRERVFFIIPEKSDIQIATDLIGITPGTYDPNREDKSDQAATGAVCNQIRTQIKKIGLVALPTEDVEADRATNNIKESEVDWVQDLFANKLELAREKLEKVMSEKDGDDLIIYKVWSSYINLKENQKVGLQELSELVEENKKNIAVRRLVPRILAWDDYSDRSLKLIEDALVDFPLDEELIVMHSDSYKSDGDIDRAVEILKESDPCNNPVVAIELSNILNDQDDLDGSLDVLHSAYCNFPKNKQLINELATVYYDKDMYKESLYLRNELAVEYSENVNYLGRLGNTCLRLDLYDNSMVVTKKANELAEGKAPWILHNIGNILNNKKLYTEAMSWLNKGIELESSSQYAHDRLSKSIKGKEDEDKLFQECCKDGRKLIRNYVSGKNDES